MSAKKIVVKGAGLQEKTEKPVWHRPVITRIDMKDTMIGSINPPGSQSLTVYVH